MTSTLDLLALADGRLDHEPLHKRAVESAAARNPAIAARLRDYRAQTRALRAAYDPILTEPIPERLNAIVQEFGDDIERRARNRPLLRLAAGLAIAVIAGGVGWHVGRDDTPFGIEWMAEAVTPMQVPALAAAMGANARRDSGIVPLPQWFAQRAKVHLIAPDLRPLGFALIGRAKVDIGGHRGLRLDYQAADGKVVNLFLRPRWRERHAGPAVSERDGVTITAWMEGPLATAVAGRMSRAQSMAVAREVSRALHGGRAPAPPQDRFPPPAGPGPGDAAGTANEARAAPPALLPAVPVTAGTTSSP